MEKFGVNLVQPPAYARKKSMENSGPFQEVWKTGQNHILQMLNLYKETLIMEKTETGSTCLS